LVKDNDTIHIDAVKNEINVLIDQEELAKRKAAWKQPKLNAENGILFKYARLVKTAAEGCVTDEL